MTGTFAIGRRLIVRLYCNAFHTVGVWRLAMEHVFPTQIWVVVPAFNEVRTIGRVVTDIAGRGFKIVVVDDGSTDQTKDAVSAADAVVRHPINLGQGAALQTGIDYALQHGADVIVTFDADGQHYAADIAQLVNALARGKVDFALGNRFLGRSTNLPPARLLLLKLAVLFTRLTTGLRVNDTHNGLRAMTRCGASAICLRQNRMAHASEILSQIAQSGLRFVEVPVTVHYTAYSLAKGQKLSDALAVLLDLFARKLYR